MKKKAFTLMELLVSIALISIITLGISNLSFKSSSDRQKLEIFSNRIISKIEEIRTNDLIGRGVLSGTELVNPDKWIIEISSIGQGSLSSSYDYETTNTNNSSIIISEGYSINTITCRNPSGGELIIDQGSIIFEKGKYNLLCGTLDNATEMSINVSFNSHSSNIVFNSITGLIKKD